MVPRQSPVKYTGKTWAEDRATRGRDPSASRGQDRRGRHDAALAAFRDWPKCDRSIHNSPTEYLNERSHFSHSR